MYPPPAPPPSGPPPFPGPAPAPQAGPPVAGPVPSPGQWSLIICWHVLVVICAYTGFNEALGGADWRLGNVLPLSQLASLATAICYALIVVAELVAATLKLPEPPTAWVRGALAIALTVVMGVWFTVMSGDVSETWSLFEHLLTPLVVLVDWFAIGRRQAGAKWWYPVTWIGPLLVWLVVLVNNQDINPYQFLDPDGSEFFPTVLGVTALGIALGYGMVAAARARRRPGAPGPGAPPPPAPPWPGGYGAPPVPPPGGPYQPAPAPGQAPWPPPQAPAGPYAAPPPPPPGYADPGAAPPPPPPGPYG